MHQSLHLRQLIAQEAARLLASGLVSDFSRARQRAARQVFRGRLSRDELPNFAEIQAFMVQQRTETGVLSHSPEHLIEELKRSIENLAQILQDDKLIVEKPTDEHLVLPGFSLRMYSLLRFEEIEEILVDAGTRLPGDLLVMNVADNTPRYFRLMTQHLEIQVYSLTDQFHIEGLTVSDYIQQLRANGPSSNQAGIERESLLDWSYAFELLPLLSGVRVDTYRHPEGDLCYHSQQVFKLGCALEPYDTEFLEACLFHDLGYLKNTHAPQSGTIDLLLGLATERTLFFIAELPVAHEYLKTGQIRGGLRKSPDFDLLIELARVDRQGREMGVSVPELEEIEEYLNSLEG